MCAGDIGDIDIEILRESMSRTLYCLDSITIVADNYGLDTFALKFVDLYI